MIAAEDRDENVRSALQEITPFSGKRVLDLGSGTGRIPLMFTDQPRQMIAFDLHRAMLAQNRLECNRVKGNWDLVQGDVRDVPLQSHWADVVTAGWAIGHMRAWYPSDWQAQMGRALGEMHRLVAPGGWMIILETMTTGSLTPAPPNPELAEYYSWLEQDWGFSRKVIPTDYQFSDIDEAAARTEFFFGPDLAAAIRNNGWSRLPEWTGVWSKRGDGLLSGEAA
ncbi:MAG: class I SAM-dependent methyltransferase [Chloroflexi bacterium]|nr:class I SAM-dependent methyltransferase [Chloroflexota bacterium]